MTAAIKRMLAEREALTAKKPAPVREPTDKLMELIDRAAPFIDEGCPQTQWPPSLVLKVGFFVIATGPAKDSFPRAANFIQAHLDAARRRFVDGLHPNPFLEGAR